MSISVEHFHGDLNYAAPYPAVDTAFTTRCYEFFEVKIVRLNAPRLLQRFDVPLAPFNDVPVFEKLLLHLVLDVHLFPPSFSLYVADGRGQNTDQDHRERAHETVINGILCKGGRNVRGISRREFGRR